MQPCRGRRWSPRAREEMSRCRLGRCCLACINGVEAEMSQEVPG